jgi:hypothetical protein
MNGGKVSSKGLKIQGDMQFSEILKGGWLGFEPEVEVQKG